MERILRRRVQQPKTEIWDAVLVGLMRPRGIDLRVVHPKNCSLLVLIRPQSCSLLIVRDCSLLVIQYLNVHPSTLAKCKLYIYIGIYIYLYIYIWEYSIYNWWVKPIYQFITKWDAPPSTSQTQQKQPPATSLQRFGRFGVLCLLSLSDGKHRLFLATTWAMSQSTYPWNLDTTQPLRIVVRS